MTCIRTHLISGASAVSLILRPEDRTRLLSSSLRSFSGPAQLSIAFLYRNAGRGLEMRLQLVLPQQLHELYTLFSLSSWAYSACVLFALLFQ